MQSIKDGANRGSQQSLPRGPAGYIGGPSSQGAEGSMDSTLRATTDSSGGSEDNE
jgi:hypothetical protein